MQKYNHWENARQILLPCESLNCALEDLRIGYKGELSGAIALCFGPASWNCRHNLHILISDTAEKYNKDNYGYFTPNNSQPNLRVAKFLVAHLL